MPQCCISAESLCSVIFELRFTRGFTDKCEGRFKLVVDTVKPFKSFK